MIWRVRARVRASREGRCFLLRQGFGGKVRRLRMIHRPMLGGCAACSARELSSAHRGIEPERSGRVMTSELMPESRQPFPSDL